MLSTFTRNKNLGAKLLVKGIHLNYKPSFCRVKNTVAIDRNYSRSHSRTCFEHVKDQLHRPSYYHFICVSYLDRPSCPRPRERTKLRQTKSSKLIHRRRLLVIPILVDENWRILLRSRTGLISLKNSRSWIRLFRRTFWANRRPVVLLCKQNKRVRRR